MIEQNILASRCTQDEQMSSEMSHLHGMLTLQGHEILANNPNFVDFMDDSRTLQTFSSGTDGHETDSESFSVDSFFSNPSRDHNLIQILDDDKIFDAIIKHDASHYESARSYPEIGFQSSIEVSDIVDVIFRDDIMFVVFSSSFPFYVQFVSTSWAEQFGWSPDEIFGLDHKFLNGVATNSSKIEAFLRSLHLQTDSVGDLNSLLYSKFHELLAVKIRYKLVTRKPERLKECSVPTFDHMVMVVSEVLSINHDAQLAMGIQDEGNGIFSDRRDACAVFPTLCQSPVLDQASWYHLCQRMSAAELLTFMLESQAPIFIASSDGILLHVNIPWVQVTGYSSLESQGSLVTSFVKNVAQFNAGELYVIQHANPVKQHVSTTLEPSLPHALAPASTLGRPNPYNAQKVHVTIKNSPLLSCLAVTVTVESQRLHATMLFSDQETDR